MISLLFAAWLARQTCREFVTMNTQCYDNETGFIGLEMLPEVHAGKVRTDGNVNIYNRIKVLRTCPEGYRVVLRPENQNFVEVGVWVTLKVECDPERPR